MDSVSLEDISQSEIKENTDDALRKDIEICISQFTQTLEENLASFIDKKPIFKCGECGKIFQMKHHLQTHMKVHIPEKSFSCDKCHKKFTLSHHLQQHIRVHTGERPYKCEVCEKAFISSSNLKRHLDTHVQKVVKMDDDNMYITEKERDYKCQKHMETHEEDEDSEYETPDEDFDLLEEEVDIKEEDIDIRDENIDIKEEDIDIK
ncbi:KRAB [Mytilus coruscus]|uniref:KRAB n=1 Tax=Mytilus coruscus TaxID=42192 RepID=A0A6J7ZZV7_MYTCO|nr:KRAB [Mytilus coruscus]